MLARRFLAALIAVFALLPAAAHADTVVAVPYGDSYDYRAVPVGGLPGFQDPAFSTAGWDRHAAPFGGLTFCTGLPEPFTGSGWGTGDLLLRRSFDVPPGAAGARLRVRIDNNVAVYLNGTLVQRRDSDGCAELNPAPVVLPPGVVKSGTNVLAVRATNDEDQSYVDVQLEVDLDRFTVALGGAQPAAGEVVTAQATVANRSTRAIDSITLDPPAGLTLPAGAELPVGLAPGEQTTVAFPVKAACDAPGGEWSASAADAVLLAAESQLTTPAAAGDCALAFTAQPRGARAGAPITDTPFAAGGPVRVALTGAAGSPVEGADVQVARVPAGALGGTTTRPVSGGSASFSDLSIAEPGDFRLRATAAGAAPVESAPFPVEQVVEPCTGASCEASIEAPGAAVDVEATTTDGKPGFLTLSVDEAPPIDCPRYRELVADTITIDGSANLSEKRVTYTIGYDTLLASWQRYGVSLTQLCFSAPYTYKPRPGSALATAPFDGDGDGTAETWYTALLPECRVLWFRGDAPCIASRRFTAEGLAVVARLPGGARDPRMRG